MPSLSLASVGAEGCCITPGSGFFKLNENVFFLLFLPELYYTAKIPLGMQTESLEITHIAHSSYSSLTRSWKGPLLQRWRICIFKSVSKYWRMAGHRAGISHILYWGFAQKLRLRRKHIRLPPACFQVQLPTILESELREGKLHRRDDHSVFAGWCRNVWISVLGILDKMEEEQGRKE